MDLKLLVTRWILLLHRWHRLKALFNVIWYNCVIIIFPLSDPIDPLTSKEEKKKKPIKKKGPVVNATFILFWDYQTMGFNMYIL